MERLYQGHLHPLLEVPILIFPRWEASTLVKNYLNSILIAIQNIYMSQRHGSPHCTCYMNIHEHYWPNEQTWLLTSGTCKSFCSISGKTDHVGVTTMKWIDQGHLHPLLMVLTLTCPSRESDPSLRDGSELCRTSTWTRENTFIFKSFFHITLKFAYILKNLSFHTVPCILA